MLSDACLPDYAKSYPAIRHHIVNSHGASLEAEQNLQRAAIEWGFIEPGQAGRLAAA